MSFDFQVWSVLPAELPDALPADPRWTREPAAGGDRWVISAATWQLTVGASTPVLPEDVPDAAMAALPGISYLTALTLEPMHAPESAHGLLRRTARAIARSAYGAVLDGESGEVSTPSGVKRFALGAPARSAPITVLELSW